MPKAFLPQPRLDHDDPAGQRSRRRRFRWVGIIGVLIVVAVLAYVPVTYSVGYLNQRRLHDQFAAESVQAITVDPSLLNRVMGAPELERLRLLAEESTKSLRDGQISGRLEVPRIGLNVIVVEGTSDADLRSGPGHLEKSALPGLGGNFVVGGERVLYGAPFLKLDDIAAGDEITFHARYGNFTYAVVDARIVDPEDVGALQPVGYEAITLFTCDPIWGTGHRLVILGRMVSAATAGALRPSV